MRTLHVPFLVLVIAACDSPIAPNHAARSAEFSSAPTITPTAFSAVAQCAPYIGENIAFGGTIQLQVHKTTDATGATHETRHFQVEGLTATGTSTGTTYTAQGGAEMFAIQVDAGGQQHVRIHSGTLVFLSTDGDHRVIAHHEIRETPGGPTVNQWTCRLVG